VKFGYGPTSALASAEVAKAYVATARARTGKLSSTRAIPQNSRRRGTCVVRDTTFLRSNAQSTENPLLLCQPMPPNLALDKGRLRMRWPVNAATAFTTAGGTPGTPGSPMPPIGAPLSMMRTCTRGIRLGGKIG
jgi:hypothetical protein